ncbi:nucleotide-binding alpha-beta plait domain-containing protein [Tanacetum coccineum]
MFSHIEDQSLTRECTYNKKAFKSAAVIQLLRLCKKVYLIYRQIRERQIKPICADYKGYHNNIADLQIGCYCNIFLKVHVFQAVWDRAARAIRFPLAFGSIAVMFRLIECGSSCTESSGSQRSKEDEVQKLSTSVFVTNFPDLFNAKDLWNTCKQYGNVVDDPKQKLNVNVARFLREPLTKKSSQFNTYGDNRHNIGVDVKNRGVKGYSNSYAHIVKGSQSSHTEMENKPALVLDNSCLNQHDYSNFLMGKVKDFASLSNLKVVLASNDFIIDGRVTWVEIVGIPLKMWSENTFNRIASIWDTLLHVENQEDECYHRKRICINTNVKSNIFESFKAIYQGKVFWVRAKEIPGWVPDFMEDDNEESDMDDAINEEESNGEDVDFKKFSASEGDNENEVVPDSMFEDELHEINGEEVYVGQNKANSEDPFNLYDLLNKKKDENNKGDCVEDSLKFPPGFTPKDTNEVTEERPNTSNESKRVSGEGVHSFQEEDTGVKKHGSKKKAKDDVVESMCPGHFQKAETPRSGGSILQSMDDMVKELTEKRLLWDYLSLVMENWNGEVIIMGDFNEVRKKAKRFGSVFNVQGADAFNMFISNAGLEEVPLAVSLDRYLSDHRSQSVEVAQKAKIKWAIEGDENSKYYHGILNKKRSQLAIRGNLIDENWTESPNLVKRNGADTLFWKDAWRGGTAFKYLYPRVYALESSKNIVVASKMAHCNPGYSFRRDPRGSVEKAQFDSMLEKVEGTLLADMRDRWMWSLEGSGDFSVASVRKLLDGNMLPEVASKTRWIKAMPIKVNVHAWRVKLDCLPTRINIFRRGMEIESIICPMCGEAAKSSRHIFFSCHIAREILRKISRWWDVSYMELSSYEEWLD